jgi:hypothetical protein
MFKLLPILFLFTCFQASAVLIGNLTYDGTYITGDGRTYVGLDTIASWDYRTTFDATQAGGVYEDFRIANTADADYFIGSLFGASADNCSTVDGIITYQAFCGSIPDWVGGFPGDNSPDRHDELWVWFIADEAVDSRRQAGSIAHDGTGEVRQNEGWAAFSFTDNYSAGGGPSFAAGYIPWLLVKDTVVSANEPSTLALMALGIFGFGFARRRR